MRRFLSKNDNVCDNSKKCNMSIEKSPQKQKFLDKTLLKTRNIGSQAPSKVIGNGSTVQYHLMLKQPFKLAPQDPTDATQLWKVAMPPVDAKIRKRIFIFKQSQYVIPQWTGDGYPNVIYIDCDDVDGFRDAYSEQSNHVAALQLAQINPYIDQSGIKGTDLRYTLKNPVAWQVSQTLTSLKFRIKLDTDTTAVTLPLQNPLTLSFQLRFQ